MRYWHKIKTTTISLHYRSFVVQLPENCCNHKTENPQICIQTFLKNEEQVSIIITDNGSGITEKVRKCIFDPFFTTKPVGKGTGMGLSISYQIIVERHQGKLQCISEPEQGASFVIDIPLRQLGNNN
ncbi:MAG: hypothetical protein HC908_15180 [Calothrix sp. SM1_7_51]|nr:hypothetical protein [Calothrix sp. SM1_7_51]